MLLTVFNPKEADYFLNGKEIASFDRENILPYTKDPFTLINGIVEDKDGIIALGICRIVNEFKVIINPNRKRMHIALAIKHLVEEAVSKCKAKGSNELFVIVTQGGIKYEKLLCKHFNFECIEGTTLRRSI